MCSHAIDQKMFPSVLGTAQVFPVPWEINSGLLPNHTLNNCILFMQFFFCQIKYIYEKKEEMLESKWGSFFNYCYWRSLTIRMYTRWTNLNLYYTYHRIWIWSVEWLLFRIVRQTRKTATWNCQDCYRSTSVH